MHDALLQHAQIFVGSCPVVLGKADFGQTLHAAASPFAWREYLSEQGGVFGHGQIAHRPPGLACCGKEEVVPLFIDGDEQSVAAVLWPRHQRFGQLALLGKGEVAVIDVDVVVAIFSGECLHLVPMSEAGLHIEGHLVFGNPVRPAIKTGLRQQFVVEQPAAGNDSDSCCPGGHRTLLELQGNQYECAPADHLQRGGQRIFRLAFAPRLPKCDQYGNDIRQGLPRTSPDQQRRPLHDFEPKYSKQGQQRGNNYRPCPDVVEELLQKVAHEPYRSSMFEVQVGLAYPVAIQEEKHRLFAVPQMVGIEQ